MCSLLGYSQKDTLVDLSSEGPIIPLPGSGFSSIPWGCLPTENLLIPLPPKEEKTYWVSVVPLSEILEQQLLLGAIIQGPPC